MSGYNPRKLEEVLKQQRDRRENSGLAELPIRAARLDAMRQAASAPPGEFDVQRLQGIALAMRQLPAKLRGNGKPGLSTIEAENVCLRLLLESFHAGAFADSRWLLWRQAIVEHPHFGTAVHWLREYGDDLGITVPWGDRSPAAFVVNGCPLIADIIEAQAAKRDNKPKLPPWEWRVSQEYQGYFTTAEIWHAWPELKEEKARKARIEQRLHTWRKNNPNSARKISPHESRPSYLYPEAMVRDAVKKEMQSHPPSTLP